MFVDLNFSFIIAKLVIMHASLNRLLIPSGHAWSLHIYHEIQYRIHNILDND